MNEKIRKALFNLVLVFMVVSIIYTIFFVFYYADDRFVTKGAVLVIFAIVYTTCLLFSKPEYIVYAIIFMSFFDVPMVSLYTSSTNVLIILSLLVIFLQSAIFGRSCISLDSISTNTLTLPLIVIIVSYTISFAFVKKGWGHHLMFYESIICASILTWMIVGTIKDKHQIIIANKIMLAVLIMNLCFSFAYLLFPHIDSIKAAYFSQSTNPDQYSSRIQGLSFRGEAYGEYLMVCAVFLISMLLKRGFERSKLILWIITSFVILTLVLTLLRGANAIFLLVVVLLILTSKSITYVQRFLGVIVICTIYAGIFLFLHNFSENPTLLNRFSYFLDEEERIGYIPTTRYYTWVPAFQQAMKNGFMGIGPSFKPYIEGNEIRDVVEDEARGFVTVWPHNITLLILCTVGFYGMLSYLFLLYRTIRLRKLFGKIEFYLKNIYSSYLLCFLALLIDMQKFDGILRSPSSNFYFGFILIALLFTCENMDNINASVGAIKTVGKIN